jgi:hypothetical protein
MPRPWSRKPPGNEGRPLPFEMSQLPSDPPAPEPAEEPQDPPAPSRTTAPPPTRKPSQGRTPPRGQAGRPKPRTHDPLVASLIQKQKQVSAGQNPAQPDVTSATVPPTRAQPVTVVRFDRDAVLAALAFAGAAPLAIAGATPPAGGSGRQPQESRCYQNPDDGSVWVATAMSVSGAAAPITAPAAELATALGGTVFEMRDGRPVTGDVTALAPIRLPELVATLMATGSPPAQLTAIYVMTAGRLARPVIRRWQRTAADVSVAQLSVEPLDSPPGSASAQVVLISIVSRAGPLPHQAVVALTELPRTLVCRAADRLLLDVRFALPMDDHQIAAEVPTDERWIVGGADSGGWRITSHGAEARPSLELSFTVPRKAAKPSSPSTAGLAADLRSLVRIVPATHPDGRADAVLLDDTELHRLRRFLSRSPLAETAFLVLGPHRHLLTEPAGLLTTVPFGVPVHRIGPGGLYLEAGYVLDPPVPMIARQELFQLDNDSIVVVCAGGAYRLALSALVPAWSLWLGGAPEPTDGISAYGQQLLAQLAPPAAPAATLGSGRHMRQHQPDRGQLLLDAERLEQRGDLAGAARSLEECGELYRAALLYQRAARETAARRR